MTQPAPTMQNLMERHDAAIIGNYGKLPVVLARGSGVKLWDVAGKEYLDFFAGFGGTILGHCHPDLVAAVQKQSNTLWQVGNQFYSEPQILLAEQLRATAFDGQAFFCHSGAEAAEAAIKLTRLSSGPGRYKIITMHKSFHGRTMGALSATPGAPQQGFAPLTPGFVHVDFNNLEALETAIDSETAGVMLEPIQSEGGMNMPGKDYLQGVRALCDKHNLCMILDEVWTGVGRTGRLFGHQHFGITPDIMTMGKALGGGLPVGGILATPRRAAFMKPGTHGCTLGGNPICAAVSHTVLEVLGRDHLPEKAGKLGEYIRNKIQQFPGAREKIKSVRGLGLFIGIELTAPDATPVLRRAMDAGLLINVTQKTVIRLCPALVMDQPDIDRGLAILEEALAA